MRSLIKHISKLVGVAVFCLTFTQLIAQQNPALAMANSTTFHPRQNVTPSRTLMRKFRRDAARLALRLEANNEDLRYQNIVIPQNTIDDIYKLLINIYQSEETARAIAKCNIHTYPNPSIDRLVLIFQRDISWAVPLSDGISETTSEAFNELLYEYDLVIDKHVQWNDNQDALTIRSQAPLNMAALANEFYNIEGIETIDLGISQMGGNDINIQRTSAGWEVEYILRFGSYINGKGKMHFWKYTVTDEGTVKFINEGGDDVPEWMRCHFEQADPLVSKG